MMADTRAESEGEDLPLAKFTLTLSLYLFFPPKFLLFVYDSSTPVELLWTVAKMGSLRSKNYILASSQVAPAIGGPTQSQLATIHGLGREFFAEDHNINLGVS